MFRFLKPLLAIIVAIVIFVTYAQPTYNETKVVRAELADYRETIDKANQLRARIDELIAERNRLSPTDLERLEVFLPDRIDEVKAVLALDALAQQNGLGFGNIRIEATEDVSRSGRVEEISESDLAGTEYIPRVRAEDESGESRIIQQFDVLTLKFTVLGSYEDFRTFVDQVEQSLLLMDISLLGITESTEGTLPSFEVAVRLYEFVPQQ